MSQRSPWATLAVIAVAQFMVVLDVTIVNVALPHIQQDLGFSAAGLQWVVSAYTLLFGGFLLLGGRVADLLGRRRMFIAGLLLFGVTSLLAGLAQAPDQLIVLRAVQGLGGALLSPAAFAILTVTFAHGRDRNIAMGVWGGLAGLGGTLGVILGGVLVDSLSWRWIFLVNVPFAVVLAVVVPMIVAESRAAGPGRRTFDLAGALLSTAGLLAIVLGVIRAEPLGWSSFEVIALLIGGAALLAAFVRVEARSAAPLVPLTLFRSRSLTTSMLALGLNGAAFLAMFFLTAIFLQQVRGLTALETGVQFLPMGFAAILSAVVASQLVTRFGTKPVQIGGAVLSIVGLVLLSRADATSGYVTSVLPGLVLFGIGIIATGTPASIAAVADVRHDQAGAASGVVNAGYQVGGALGLAVITTLSTSHVTALLGSGSDPQDALVAGFERGLLLAAVFAAANILTALGSPRLRPTSEQMAEAAVAA
ncbi:DHA2 family efflux MFS transporter permease subunit [Actinoplanes sp. N902-109]|uniref:DHA2 family efflux MFS transporter permease subunit n=1 Tax=Actinoplanes sp. (strain N902-109) TaxID=649831 RepID=UPI00032963D3|nr:DHA2 family efflux MFS transporter permease subunit [Actinoplanes sp. N902-109]AGL21512.1 EmrB/QacA subfamily drug resistance transporter [Actinoplanes sp. N902-109]